MLAIPRIDALSEGAKSAARPKPADQATSGTASFITLLAGLVGQKAANGLSGDKSAALESKAAAGKKPAPVAIDTRKNTDNLANAQKAAVANSAGAAVVTRNTGAKANDNTAVAQKVQEDKNRNDRSGTRSADRSAARTGADYDAMSAAALSATVASARTLAPGQPSAPRGAAIQTRSRADGAGDKAIETIGSGIETRPNGAKVSVVDLRLKAARPQSDSGSGEGQSGKKSLQEEATHVATTPDHGMINAGDRLGSDIGPTGTRLAYQAPQTPVATHGSLSESLAARLRDGAADIVRSAQVVLRNGDVGLIRMRLEPETLGGVKIELKMAEKQISGRIIVESDVAGEAFRSSINALKDAFAESGFDVRSLEVEVRNSMASGGGADGKGADRGSAEAGDGPYWSRSLRELDAAVPTVARSGRDGLLNVLV